jgi:protein-S-isoprenylcysteine O-methyltransferase Ste14
MMVAIGKFLFRHRNFLFPVVFVLMLFEETFPVIRDERPERWMLFLGLAMALTGQILRALTVGLAYIKRGGKDKQVYADKLVTDGIFAHCRNPLYLGNLMIVTGVGISSNSLPFLLFGVPFFVFAYMAIIKAEEEYLRARFGAEFNDYCQRVNRLIPNFQGFLARLQTMEFHWKRLVVKEYQTPFLWMSGFLFLVLKDEYLDWGYEASKNRIWCLCGLFGILTLLFLLAWWLKKTKVLRAD